MCSKKLTGSQLSPPHGITRKLKCETKNKTMSMIRPVQSRCHEGSPVGKRSLRWEGFVEKVGFEPGVKEWWMLRVVMIIEMSWQVSEEVSRDMTGKTDVMIYESGSWLQRHGDAYLNERSVIFNEMVGGRERVTTDEERVLQESWTEIRLLRI